VTAGGDFLLVTIVTPRGPVGAQSVAHMPPERLRGVGELLDLTAV
jgi:hypothetical protein